MFRVFTCLTAEHDWRLVILAGVVCFLASLTAISLFHRARETTGRTRAIWLVTAGAATGCGIWATHFVAMLAYDPGIPIGYDVGLTVLSLAAAMAITTIGFGVAIYSSAPWSAPLGGGIVGAGVASMHYLGMSAVELPGHVAWAPHLVLASIVLGMLFGTVALAIAVRRGDNRATVAAALLLTLAIVSHHFTAMGAVEIVPDPTRVINAFSLSPTTLALAIANAAVAVLGMSLAGAFADRRLQARDLRLIAAVNNMPQGLVAFDAEERLIACNDRYIEMYGLPREIIKPGCTLRDVIRSRIDAGSLDRDPEQYRSELVTAIAQGKTTSWVVETADGRAISIINKPMTGGEWIGTHEDITERRNSERNLERTQTFLNTIIENVPATLVVKDAREHRYVLINRAGEELFGLAREEMIGKNAYDLFAKEQADLIIARDTEALQSGGQLVIEGHPLQTPRKGNRLVTTKRLAIHGDNGEPQYLLGVIEDITERKRSEEQIAYMAHHDALTDLPNRAAFTKHLADTLERAARLQENFALLCIDLDRFKEVNDVFGHSVGDELLRQVSRRLAAAAGGAFLARLGGDEFTLVAAEGPQPATAESLVDRLLVTVEEDFEIDGHRLRSGLSIGVAIFPTDGANATTLLGNADAALYRAKAEGRGTFRFFAADLDKRLRERRALQHDLLKALPRRELVLHYQPQALIGGEIVGFEALVRWQHPSLGLLPPGTFIPLAEESGLIISMGEWILRAACREAASWPRPLQVAVNLSPIQFRHGDLAGLVHAVLLDTGLAPHRLELEITEGVLIGDFSRAVSILRRLKSLGVRIAMDDFGTGYSSLSYLQSFPFDKIKIDQAFITNVDHNAQSAAIVRAIISLSRGLDLPVVAEGVETQNQLDFLSRESCDEVQGFLLGRPRPIEDYAELVGRTMRPEKLVLAG